jgi:site-specific DNA recombinase
MRVAIYARFSDAERQNARSCEDQIALCRAHAERRGWTVVAVYQDDGISGFAMANRPGILAAVAAALRGEFDVLLVEDEDRLARNLGHLAQLKDEIEFAGGRLATLQHDVLELMHVAFKGSGAQQYLIDLGRKTRRGVRANAERGLWLGGRKYGYRSQPGGATTIDAAEADVVRRIFTLFADDHLTFREIADTLNREGVPALRGNGWCASTLHGDAARGNGILRSELYAGVKVWNRDEVRKDPRTGRRIHHWKPPQEWQRKAVPELRIVDADLWDRAQVRLADTAQGPLAARGNRLKPGLFQGLVKCGACGSTFGSHGRGRLACVGRREKGLAFCGVTRMIDRRSVDESILQGLKTRLLSPAAVLAYVRAYHRAWAAQEAAHNAARAPLERRAAELARQVERAVDALLAAPRSAALAQRLTDLEAEQAKVAAELAQAPAAAPLALHPHAAEGYAALVQQLADTLNGAATEAAADPANRRLVEQVRKLVTKIELIEDASADTGFRLRLHGALNLLLAEHPAADGPHVGGPMVPGGGYGPVPTPFVVDVPLSKAA